MPRATHRTCHACRHRVLAPRTRKRRTGVQRCPHQPLHSVIAPAHRIRRVGGASSCHEPLIASAYRKRTALWHNCLDVPGQVPGCGQRSPGAMCRDATRYKASGAMRSRGEAGKVLRGDAWQSGDRRLRQCRRGRSTRAAQHRREQAVPRTPPQAWGFADVKVATRLGAKSSRVGWCASTVRRVSSPRPCFGCSREENPSATVPTTDTETHLPRSPAGPHLRGSSSHSALTDAPMTRGCGRPV